jgi:hypothetical protein
MHNRIAKEDRKNTTYAKTNTNNVEYLIFSIFVSILNLDSIVRKTSESINITIQKVISLLRLHSSHLIRGLHVGPSIQHDPDDLLLVPTDCHKKGSETIL